MSPLRFEAHKLRRLSAPGEWRTNISLGGTHLPTGASAKPAAIALAAAAAIDADFVGIDLLPSSDGYLVLEVPDGTVVFAGRIGSPLDPGVSLFRMDPHDHLLHFIAGNNNTNDPVPSTDGFSTPLASDSVVTVSR